MKKTTYVLLVLALGLAALLAVGCGGAKDEEGNQSGDDDGSGDDDNYPPGYDDFLNAIPDPETLRLTLPGSDKAATLTLGEMATYYEETVDLTRDVNYYIYDLLGAIDEITSYPPTTFDGETAVWGPWDNGGLSPVDARFTMTNVSGQHFDFVWEWRDKDLSGEEDWVVIWDGEVEASESTQRRGVGNFHFDYWALDSLDPTWDVSGEINVDYDTLIDGRRIDIEFLDFVGEEDDEPLDGVYKYHEHADLTGEFLFDVWANISEEPEDTAEEHLWFNTRWNPDGDGRCDVRFTDGDLPANDPPLDWATASECWDHDFARVYYVEQVKLTGGGTYTTAEEGEANDCTFEEQIPDAQ